VNDNKSINKAIPELINFVLSCKKLEYLNISNLNMTKHNCMKTADGIIEAIKVGSNLRELVWDSDLIVSHSTATDFLKRVS
jgi:hypothetical protein